LTSPDADSGALVPLEVQGFSGGAFSQNTYLVRCTRTNRAVAVDPGAATTELLAELEAEGAELDAIYLTHAHIDHIEGIPLLRQHVSAPIYMHPADRPIYDRAEELAREFGIRMAGPLPPPDEELVPGESVPVGDHRLEVRFAPGHAPGHVVLYAADSGILLAGDVIFRGTIGRTDLPGGDFQTLIASIRSAVLTLPEETRILSGHGAETTVRAERLGNPFLISQAAGKFA
jgi:hydroxyacylglutathione hydrolase